MKHGNGWLKGLAVLVCVLVFMGGTWPAQAGRWTTSYWINTVTVTIDGPIEAGNEIPFTATLTSNEEEVTLSSSLSWIDLTKDEVIKPNEHAAFLEGHKYQVDIEVHIGIN